MLALNTVFEKLGFPCNLSKKKFQCIVASFVRNFIEHNNNIWFFLRVCQTGKFNYYFYINSSSCPWIRVVLNEEQWNVADLWQGIYDWHLTNNICYCWGWNLPTNIVIADYWSCYVMCDHVDANQIFVESCMVSGLWRCSHCGVFLILQILSTLPSDTQESTF